MKGKKIISLFMGALTVVFMGCEKEISTSPVTIDLLPKASISGYVGAELDLQAMGYEAAPEGTMLLVSVPYSSLNPAATTGEWQDTVKVDASGKYTAQVPTTSNGVNVTIRPISFEAIQNQSYGSVIPRIPYRYSSSVATVFIASLQSVSRDFIFNTSALPLNADKVLYTGTVRAEIDATKAGREYAPDGTIIRFYNATWKDSAVISNGKFSVFVPYGVTFNLQVAFNASKISIGSASSTTSGIATTSVNYSYEYASSVSAQYTDVLDYVVTVTPTGSDASVDPLVTSSVSYLFTMRANLNATNDSPSTTYESVPDNTLVYFWSGSPTISSATWATTAMVSNGKITIPLPESTTVYYQNVFLYNQTTSGGSVGKTYTLSGSLYVTAAPAPTQTATLTYTNN